MARVPVILRPPASTLMIVGGFARPEFLVEVEVIAAGPAGEE
jgi:enamine deaminase RidA (YjgF/YER057c/UK114 family)